MTPEQDPITRFNSYLKGLHDELVTRIHDPEGHAACSERLDRRVAEDADKEAPKTTSARAIRSALATFHLANGADPDKVWMMAGIVRDEIPPPPIVIDAVVAYAANIICVPGVTLTAEIWQHDRHLRDLATQAFNHFVAFLIMTTATEARIMKTGTQNEQIGALISFDDPRQLAGAQDQASILLTMPSNLVDLAYGLSSIPFIHNVAAATEIIRYCNAARSLDSRTGFKSLVRIAMTIYRKPINAVCDPP